MGCIGSKCNGNDYEGILTDGHSTSNKPTMRMCAPGKDSTNFADVGDKIILYVDFGDLCSPCRLEGVVEYGSSALERVRAAASSSGYRNQERYEEEVQIAGQITKLIKLHPAVLESKSYKAIVTIPSSYSDHGFQGAKVSVTLPYNTTADSRGQQQQITEEEIHDNNAVYFQSLWKQLKEHNTNCYLDSVSHQSSSLSYGGRYGSLAERGTDNIDGSERIETSVEREAIRSEEQRREDQKPQRLWPDSWQMKCWAHCCCKSIMRSKKTIPRFIARFFVAPLTNVTGLSLYYQLYLAEIFHTKFLTRLFHYICMPLIVLMILIFFAQWRFVFDNDASDCYKTNNFEVLIWNGALLVALLLLVWYLIWGVCQKTYLMGIFMTGPLVVLVILANIYFQISIKNTLNTHLTDECWDHTVHAGGMVQYYNLFHLMHWYYNPLFWLGVFCMFQSLSHIFEPKIPPRVSQTAHWMSCLHMFKQIGYTKTLCILSAQAVFGAVDEFLASPRLLPLLALRVCYELGYNQKEWKRMKKLVKMCSEYGDPAIDFIGVGGARHPSYPSSIVIQKGVTIVELKKEVRSMKHVLSTHQQRTLVEPALLHQHKKHGKLDSFLEHYVTLRHHVAKYTLQLYAYGPFRDNSDEHQVQIDDERMMRDFGNNTSFLKFLNQVRLGLWKMEDDLLDHKPLSDCCSRHVEDV